MMKLSTVLPLLLSSISLQVMAQNASVPFLRRVFHSSFAVNDWIYIDGGEISRTNGVSMASNTTFAIDLSRNWKNSTLNLVSTARPPTSLAENYQALFWHPGDSSIYCFGGEKTFIGNDINRYKVTPPNSIWRFKPDGEGRGIWETAFGPTSDNPFPSNVTRPAAGASTASSKKGYYLGGYASFRTDPKVSLPFGTDQPLPGLLSFDFASSMWSNTSDGGFMTSNSPIDKRVSSGSMQYVPSFATDGILLVLGGTMGQGINAFNNITIYDIHTENWLSQIATGDIPDPRDHFCLVGVQSGQNETYELFIHGGILYGQHGPDNARADEVYILSLPAFRWFRANYTSTFPRAYHTCHVARSSQMVIIGGLDPSQSDSVTLNDWQAAGGDPWTQGIGVFNMKTLEWKDSYDAKPAGYEAPDMVKRYYANSLRYPSSWSSAEVQHIFTSNNMSIITDPVPSPGPDTAHKSHPGTIAGAVIGAIAGLVLLIAGAWYCIRHRKVKQQAAVPPTYPEFHQEVRENGVSLLPELPAKEATVELSAGVRVPQELPGTTVASELSSSHR